MYTEIEELLGILPPSPTSKDNSTSWQIFLLISSAIIHYGVLKVGHALILIFRFLIWHMRHNMMQEIEDIVNTAPRDQRAKVHEMWTKLDVDVGFHHVEEKGVGERSWNQKLRCRYYRWRDGPRHVVLTTLLDAPDMNDILFPYLFHHSMIENVQSSPEIARFIAAFLEAWDMGDGTGFEELFRSQKRREYAYSLRMCTIWKLPYGLYWEEKQFWRQTFFYFEEALDVCGGTVEDWRMSFIRERSVRPERGDGRTRFT